MNNKIIVPLIGTLLIATSTSPVNAAPRVQETSVSTSSYTVQLDTTSINSVIPSVAQLRTIEVGNAYTSIPTAQPAPALSVKDLAKQMTIDKFGASQWAAVDALVYKESTWNPTAVNRSSGACDLFQADPCTKITDHSIKGQITWGLNYIQTRYTTPIKAWAHEVAYGWF